ncbi:4-hydroxy-2-oxoheptanedioate aldolase [Brucella gallinifaecis]|uniref:4-hydroxy-2-oxoheptanedioate aldolase n=1 Tax=Brucella gallinifaecis TaxID=215590 RepID=A0A502BLX5_9HYPH|nr:4-hydroxy-2-oxoheptanedioate aldolase [Brucella gallinifaecis]TPF74689.1 4-hydroxy-2-oxoheptanedioate aldolase [Brucella gallinifaecis]
MPVNPNNFKAALKHQQLQIGLWLGLANAYTAEIAAGAGFDWLLIDGEHAPNDIRSMLAQLHSIGISSHPVIRLPVGEIWMIKQVLDIGAQTILVPMVETAQQAKALVDATRYPPNGVRGVGAALARASAFNRTADYLKTADDQICLLVQVESRRGIASLDAILNVDGIDGVFIGPADLAADLGFLGRPGAAEVQSVVEDALLRIVASGKAAGILTADNRLARRYIDLGATFVAVGSDVGLFASATSALAAAFKSDEKHSARQGSSDTTY